jgi:hypothetical protein
MIKQEIKEDTNIVGLRDFLQKLSFDQLLKELGVMKLKLGVIIPTIFEKGKEKGLNEIEIRDKIKKAIDIPERTLNPYLPEAAKRHKYPKNCELANSANYNENTEKYTSTSDPTKSLEVNSNNTKDVIENRKQYDADGLGKDKMSGQARIVYDENSQTAQSEILKELQCKIGNLEDQLKQEQSKNEELSIQNRNASNIITQFWDQLHDSVRILLLTREKFPPNFGQVFESQDHVFVVEFKGTKVLDISVMSQQQANNQYLNEKLVTEVRSELE